MLTAYDWHKQSVTVPVYLGGRGNVLDKALENRGRLRVFEFGIRGVLVEALQKTNA